MLASMLFSADARKCDPGTVARDDPDDMVDGLCVPSRTESPRNGGVGGIDNF